VVTNNHVIADAEELVVTTAAGRRYSVEVVGSDPPSDVAVLRLEGDLRGVRPLTLGSSDDLRLGEVVLAVGNPFGLEHTVTMGIVSAKGRADVGIVEYEDFIQTDAAINPGNSGGALVNMRGELVGINTAIASRTGGYQGIGFAIPSDMVRTIMESLVKTGRFIRGYLGVNIQNLTPELAESLNIQQKQGVVVASVEEGSPAARAGLRRYDVITAIDGKPVTSAAEMRNLISLRGPGSGVALNYVRDGTERTATVTIGEYPARTAQRSSTGKGTSVSEMGLTLRELNSATREQFDIPLSVRNGIVIAKVTPESDAARSGFQAGDIILEIDRRPVSSVNHFPKSLHGSGEKIPILLYRNGALHLIAIPR
jgi:serine protease Do